MTTTTELAVTTAKSVVILDHIKIIELSICYWLRSATLSEQQRSLLRRLLECVRDGEV